MNDGKKYDQNKSRWDLVPYGAMDDVGKVLAFGANKYGANNWKLLENLETRYMAAAMRHISAHMQGEEVDSESGFPHLAHASCCLLFVQQYKKESNERKRNAITDMPANHDCYDSLVLHKMVSGEKRSKDPCLICPPSGCDECVLGA